MLYLQERKHRENSTSQKFRIPFVIMGYKNLTLPRIKKEPQSTQFSLGFWFTEWMKMMKHFSSVKTCSARNLYLYGRILGCSVQFFKGVVMYAIYLWMFLIFSENVRDPLKRVIKQVNIVWIRKSFSILYSHHWSGRNFSSTVPRVSQLRVKQPYKKYPPSIWSAIGLFHKPSMSGMDM